MTDEVQNQQSQPEADTGNDGSIDAAAEAFAKLGQPDPEEDHQETTTDEAEPDDEAAEESTEEAEEADPEEDSEADDLVEVEIEGKTYKVPQELQKGYLRQSDYSRKMNEVSAKEKTYTQRIEQVEALGQMAEKRAEVLADIKSIDARIEQYKGIDWATAKAEKPAEAALAALELMELQNARRDAQERAQNVEKEFGEGRSKINADKRDAMVAALEKDLPGWGDELGGKITSYARELGYTDGDLLQVTDPKWVIAMAKAMKYDALQKSKGEIKAKVKDAPKVVKPGAARVKVDAKTDAMARLRKSNSLDDAAAAFLAQSNRR